MCVKVAGDKCECVCWGAHKLFCHLSGGGGLEKIYCETGGGGS